MILTLSDFAGLIGDEFGIDGSDGAIVLKLTEAGALPAHPWPGQVRKPFALLFGRESGAILPQGSYRLRHATLGTVELMLVPVQDAAGIRHEAVFT